MINGKLFAKFQKLLPKMHKGCKAGGYAKNSFFMADMNLRQRVAGFLKSFAPESR